MKRATAVRLRAVAWTAAAAAAALLGAYWAWQRPAAAYTVLVFSALSLACFFVARRRERAPVLPVFLALLIFATSQAPVAGAAVPSAYVQFVDARDFQYRSDLDVTVAFQAQLVRANVPRDDVVHIQVQDVAHHPFLVLNAQDLQNGVEPYPATNQIRLGHLEAGLYQLHVIATADGNTKDVSLDISVVLPPIPYGATLGNGLHGKEGALQFAPEGPGTYVIRVYQLSAKGQTVLTELRTNHTAEVRVPYVRGQATYVDVEDPNGWLNHDHDGAPYVWYPDADEIQSVKDQSLAHFWVVFIGAAALLGLTFFFVRRLRNERKPRPEN
jgi:hypothetical protein